MLISSNGLFSHQVPGDEEYVNEMAAYFQERKDRVSAFKYGISKGEGYDFADDDSFIDDSEDYDEIIPPGMETARGGFYINCGELELVEVSQPEDTPKDEKEAEREHAAMLQQLKRKRKPEELDNIQEAPKKAPKLKSSKPQVVPAPVPGTSNPTTPVKPLSILQNDDDDIQIVASTPPKERNGESILKQKVSQPKAPSTEDRYLQLRTTLLRCKVPYGVINKVPTTKVALQANGFLPNEWNVFLAE